MNEFEKALQKVRQRQMTHEDRSEGDRRVRDALKTMEEMVVPQSPAEAAMMLALGPIGGKTFKGASMATGLLASDDAEAAFIGPKGIERLKKAGGNMKEFTSRFFGDRAEINPSDAANVWWRMGNPLQKMDEILKSVKSRTLLQDIIHRE